MNKIQNSIKINASPGADIYNKGRFKITFGTAFYFVVTVLFSENNRTKFD